MSVKWPKAKLACLFLLFLLYISVALSTFFLAKEGILPRLPPPPTEIDANLQIYAKARVMPNVRAAEEFVNSKLRKESGHVDLYYSGLGIERSDSSQTNSEAMSYYLLWNAQKQDKERFDAALAFIEEHMTHPEGKFLMWRLEENNEPVGDGVNIASDADIRAIKALLIAENQWTETKYTQHIDSLAVALENVAITQDNHLAPYGGISDGTVWKTEEVWLSYSDFEVFRELALRRGEPWRSVYMNTKQAVLNSQLPSGMYETKLTPERTYANLDNEIYSINSLWVMVRAAESDDKDLQNSARKALEVYKRDYKKTGMLHNAYDKEGNPAAQDDSVWVYALAGRAAIHLEEEAFAERMIEELHTKQILNTDSEIYGGFPEGGEDQLVGQFSTQEAILTIQDYENRI